MKTYLPLLIVLVIASAYGLWYQRSRGAIRTVKAVPGNRLSATAMSDVKHIHIDAESHLELVRQLDIRSTPTTLFLNSEGVEVGRAAGTPKREQVLAALNAI